MTLAFSSKHPFVPNPKKDQNASRWIASLSDGTTVFEDVTPNEKTAWRRLQEYVKIHKLKVTNLRLEAYGRSVGLIPYKDDEGRPQINGYWQAKRGAAFLNAAGNQYYQWSGIGYLKGRDITIVWVDPQGNLTQEVRPYSRKDEDGVEHVDQGCIINNAV